MILVFFVFIAICVPIGLFLNKFLRRSAITFNIDVKNKYVKRVIFAISIACSLLCMFVFGNALIFIMHLIVIELLMNLLNFIIKKIASKKYDDLKIWKKIFGSGFVSIIIAAVFIVYGHYNMMNVVATDYEISTEKEIRDEGYRMALIADVHYGISIDVKELERICEEISKKSLDFVILCGDIVDENTELDEMKDVFSSLGKIESKYGIFFVYGNHDRQPYSDDKQYTEEQLETAITNAGITILSDEQYTINDELTIIGREDAKFINGSTRKPLEELFENVNPDNYIIVLDHQPKEYLINSELGSDLILSGHTHAGQIWPANLLFEIIKFDDAVYGHVDIDNTQAIVTSGMAGWGYSIKTSSPAEYAIIDISSEN